MDMLLRRKLDLLVSEKYHLSQSNGHRSNTLLSDLSAAFYVFFPETKRWIQTEQSELSTVDRYCLIDLCWRNYLKQRGLSLTPSELDSTIPSNASPLIRNSLFSGSIISEKILKKRNPFAAFLIHCRDDPQFAGLYGKNYFYRASSVWKSLPESERMRFVAQCHHANWTSALDDLRPSVQSTKTETVQEQSDMDPVVLDGDHRNSQVSMALLLYYQDTLEGSRSKQALQKRWKELSQRARSVRYAIMEYEYPDLIT
jgi:hypothetical protein